MERTSQLALPTFVVEFRGEGDELGSRRSRNDGSACGALRVMSLDVGQVGLDDLKTRELACFQVLPKLIGRGG